MSLSTFVFIISWERPIYTWVCLDSLHRLTNSECKIVIADNNSKDLLVRQVIKGFERRGLFYRTHYCDQNDPKRLSWLINKYWDEIGEYFVLIESDIQIVSKDDCWLAKMEYLMKSTPNLAILGSAIVKNDFVDIEEAKKLKPATRDEDLINLVKARSPERKEYALDPEIIDPHTPPLRLTMYRKRIFREIEFGRDVYNKKQFRKLGYETGISTSVKHRHLSLMNIYDYPEYDTGFRNNFFAHQKKYEFVDLGDHQKVICIMGMHRSGTSCLTGSLENLGLFLGNAVSDFRPYNNKGTKEVMDLRKCQRDILKSYDYDWRNPAKCYDWKGKHFVQMEEILTKEFYGREIWGFKDPRTLFTLYGWFNLIPKVKFTFIASFRNPLSVAKSLHHRDHFTIADGLDLWNKYNLQLLSLFETLEIHLVNFDVPQQEYRDRVKHIYTTYVTKTENEDINFHDLELINQHHSETTEIPESVRNTYDKLQNIYRSQIGASKLTNKFS